MSEIVDEFLLQVVEAQHLLAVDKDYERSGQNNCDEEREDQNHHPGPGFQKFAGVEMIAAPQLLKSGTDADIPVDVKRQGRGQGQDRENKNKNGMKKPTYARCHVCIFAQT